MHWEEAICGIFQLQVWMVGHHRFLVEGAVHSVRMINDSSIT